MAEAAITLNEYEVNITLFYLNNNLIIASTEINQDP